MKRPFQPRFVPRFKMPEEEERGARIETGIATLRALLSVVGLVAIYLDPTEPSRYAALAYTLLVLYVLYSIGAVALLRVWRLRVRRFPIVSHTIDVTFCACITLLTEGPSSPFFVYFTFVLIAAAYRWGFRETMTTAITLDVLVFGEALIMAPRPFHPASFFSPDFDLNRFILRTTYLLLMGVLLGYLAGQEKQLREESLTVARIIARAQSGSGLRNTLRPVLEELMKLFRAQGAMVVAREASGGRIFLWRASYSSLSGEFELSHSEVPVAERSPFLMPAPGHSWYAQLSNGSSPKLVSLKALDAAGRVIRETVWRDPVELFRACGASSLAAAEYTFSDEWQGHLILLEPELWPVAESRLRFLQTVLRELSPALQNAYLLRRLRSHIGAIERARIARELHDGAIHSLLAAEMQVEVIRRRSEPGPGKFTENLGAVQELLHQEALNLRELMEQMKPIDVGPREFVGFLSDAVEKFGRETGIQAHFHSDLDGVMLPPRARGEVIRIIQEALANVRRHSRATSVEVRLESAPGQWRLEIQDNGSGFRFQGRYTQTELDARVLGPRVIKERVRSLGAHLAIASQPGKGSRIEIIIPRES